MNQRLKSLIMAILIIFSFTCGLLNSRIIANRGENTIDHGDERSIYTGNNIVEGAANYLNSYSTYLTLLNRIELSDVKGIDYDELTQIIDKIIATMERAESAYMSLVFNSFGTESNYDFLYRLYLFDYDGFAKKKRLNTVIFDSVTRYLKNGDVIGVFVKLWNDSSRIKLKLYEIKTYITARNFPDLSLLWALNQDFSQTMFFGQYAAQVFFAVDGEFI